MTMKKRIFISNTIMVLISLLILLAVGGICAKMFKSQILDIIQQNSELSDNAYDVQTILMEQQESPDTWLSLERKLSDYEFELYVSDSNKDKVYSNARPSELECIEQLEKSEIDSDIVKLYSMERITIARCVVNVAGQNYTVYAANSSPDNLMWGIDRGVLEMFFIVFIVAGIVVIAGLLLCCQIFTRWMIKRIMRPVDELNSGAERVMNGNLDEPVVYNEDDEFGVVCNTFNEMQKNLKEGMEKNERYERARTEMVSGISHDLRTPLTSVKGFIKGMIDGVANTPEKQEQYLKISYKKACDMEVLLQKLFFFSKLETGNMPFYPQEISINQWIDRYAQDKQIECEEKNYTITVNNSETESTIMADSEQLKRVFDNLIENSLKYAGTDDLKITISAQNFGKETHLYISDNGAGVDEDKLPHIFEQFYRGDEARNSKNDGSGLGLYVCRYIVEQQGGEIKAYNNNGLTVEIIWKNVEGDREADV